MKHRTVVLAVLVGCLAISGCTTSTGQGAGIGAAGGALIGGLATNSWQGAAIGAGAGAITGAIIGHEVGKVKYCPVCRRDYQKEEYYCPYDGTQLAWK